LTTVVFVHGIGVRNEDYPNVLPWVEDAVRRADPTAVLEFCYWGDECGARLLAGGACDPAISVPSAAPDQIANMIELWSRLDLDPLYELRLLAAAPGARAPRGAGPAPDQPMPGRQLEERTRALADDPTVIAALGEVGLADVLAPAVAVVLDAAPTRTALSRADQLGDGLRVTLARAIVATALLRAGDGKHAPALDGERIQAVVDVITDQLGRLDLGLGMWVLGGLGRVAAWRREALFHKVMPYAGDVIKYINRGEPLRAKIRKTVEAAEPPVVVIAHSLGGIACVDLFAEPDPPKVELLLTVGSQAPYLYEIDALSSLRFGDSPPPSFPRWINVYDRRDLLAFVAEPLFPGWAADREIDTKAPFPRAHLAYFSNPAFHRLLGEVLG